METDQFDLKETLPQRLRQLRKNRDWSQGQLGKKVGVDAQRISQYERGLASPPLDMAIKLAAVFDISVDYLIQGKSYSDQKIKNDELLNRFEDLEKLPHEYQQTIISVLDSFIKRYKFEELAKN